MRGAVSVALAYTYFDDNPRSMLQDRSRATLIVATLLVGVFACLVGGGGRGGTGGRREEGGRAMQCRRVLLGRWRGGEVERWRGVGPSPPPPPPSHRHLNHMHIIWHTAAGRAAVHPGWWCIDKAPGGSDVTRGRRRPTGGATAHCAAARVRS